MVTKIMVKVKLRRIQTQVPGRLSEKRNLSQTREISRTALETLRISSLACHPGIDTPLIAGALGTSRCDSILMSSCRQHSYRSIIEGGKDAKGLSRLMETVETAGEGR